MKILKKVLCLILALTVLLSCSSAAFGAEEYEGDHLPQVFVTGIGSAKIYYENDPEKKSLFWPFETERFIKNLGNIGAYITEAVKNKDANVLRAIVYGYLMDCFGMLAFTPECESLEGVTVEPTVLSHDGDGKYTFYYDSRQAPTVIAPQLNDYIHLVMEATGSDKVELVGSSYGANAVTAFLYAFPEELHHIDSLLLCVPSVGGMRFLGEVISGNFNINPRGLCDFISNLADAQFIPDFLYLMEEAGILGIFLEALVVPALRESIYAAVIDVARDAVATVPALWVCVPDENFEAAMINMYGEDYKNPNHKYAKLIAEMSHYHYDVANKAVEIYTEAVENNDMVISIITKFGSPAIPLTSGETIMDDSLVTVPVSSFGATCVNYGEQLPADYVQQRYTEYNFMCPEWNIDASTGVFPFNTWYIKGLGHSKKNADYMKFVDEIIYKDLDVFTDPDRPQYLTVSEDDPEKLVPLVAEEKTETFYDKIMAVFKRLMQIPRMILERLFGYIV